MTEKNNKTLEAILDVLTSYYLVSSDSVFQTTRSSNIIWMKQVFFFLAKKFTDDECRRCDITNFVHRATHIRYSPKIVTHSAKVVEMTVLKSDRKNLEVEELDYLVQYKLKLKSPPAYIKMKRIAQMAGNVNVPLERIAKNNDVSQNYLKKFING